MWYALGLAAWLAIGAESARVGRGYHREIYPYTPIAPWGAHEWIITLLGPVGAVSVFLAILLEPTE